MPGFELNERLVAASAAKIVAEMERVGAGRAGCRAGLGLAHRRPRRLQPEAMGSRKTRAATLRPMTR